MRYPFGIIMLYGDNVWLPRMSMDTEHAKDNMILYFIIWNVPRIQQRWKA